MIVREETVTTRYAGATERAGSAIVATFMGHRMTVPYNYAAFNAHKYAAQQIVDRYAPGYHVAYVGETRSRRGNRYAVVEGASAHGGEL